MTLNPGSLFGSTLRHTFRPQGCKDWLLIHTLAGSGLHRFPGGEYRTHSGDITLYRPGTFQDYQISLETKKWDVLFVHFLPKPDWLSWLKWPEKSPGFMALTLEEPALHRRVARRLGDMIRLDAGSLSRPQALSQNALEEVLLWCDSINPREAASQLDPRLRRGIDFLGEHMAEPFSEERLARAAGLSASRLRYLFRAQTGNSPRRFLEEQRLRRARDLLALSRQTIGEIAAELGFANPFYFTLRFKRQTGESPRAFRQRTTRK
jgi:AraC family transcriptional regulator, arabinose operon regulatory protein